MKTSIKVDFTKWLLENRNRDSPLKIIYYELQIISPYLPNIRDFIVAIDNCFYSIQNEIKDNSVIVPNIRYDESRIERYKLKALDRFIAITNKYGLLESTTYNAIIIYLLKSYILNNKSQLTILENEKQDKPHLAAFRMHDELYYSNIIICFEYCLINIEQKYYEHKNDLPFEILDEFINEANPKNIINKTSILNETNRKIYIKKEFNFNFTNNQLSKLVELINEIKLFVEPINVETLKCLFNCKVEKPLKVNNNKHLAHFFSTLSIKYNCNFWQDIIDKNKLFVGRRGAIITSKNLSVTIQMIDKNSKTMLYISNTIKEI
jgi:hypothetical protein